MIPEAGVDFRGMRFTDGCMNSGRNWKRLASAHSFGVQYPVKGVS